MNTEILINILIFLVCLNFLLWIAFLVYLFFQLRRLFKNINKIIGNVSTISSTVAGSAVKIAVILFGLLKGFNTVKSITTLGDIFDIDLDDKEEGGDGK